MTPLFFDTTEQMYEWFGEHHDSLKEVFIGFHKKGSGRQGVDYASAVGVALCFGWIDGVLRPIDDVAYALRFTPRKPGSIWSKVNINRVEALMAKGLMQPAGVEAFERRKAERSGVYAFEQESVAFEPEAEAAFRANEAAWAFFEAQAPSYQRAATWTVTSAKRPETRAKRLATLIETSERGARLPQLSKYSKPRDQR